MYALCNDTLKYRRYKSKMVYSCHCILVLLLLLLFVDRRELDEHRLTVHLLTCGICGEMSNTRDEVKSCFFSHLVYITDGEGES